MMSATGDAPPAPEGPGPVVRTNGQGRSGFLLIGDHAGTAIPERLGRLGLADADLARHIASDIGVRGLGEALADRLDAVFLHQHYSRLVIDCNRDPGSDEAIPAVSDGTAIPGNAGIDAAERARRIATIHAPYQQAIAAEIAHRVVPPVLVSLHSFTPVLAGSARPWHVGVLHDGHADGFALALLDALRRRGDLPVGDNAPYRMDATDHTVPRHAFGAGLRYAELEVRQDLIADAAGQRRWCAILADALEQATG